MLFSVMRMAKARNKRIYIHPTRAIHHTHIHKCTSHIYILPLLFYPIELIINGETREHEKQTNKLYAASERRPNTHSTAVSVCSHCYFAISSKELNCFSRLRPMKFSTCLIHANTGKRPGIRYDIHRIPYTRET